MYSNSKVYEIHDSITGEVLVDKLTFEEAAEQFETYQNFFGTDAINVCVRRFPNQRQTIKHTTPGFDYKKEWVNYFAELQLMGNLS